MRQGLKSCHCYSDQAQGSAPLGGLSLRSREFEAGITGASPEEMVVPESLDNHRRR
ncbi:MAG TPA: hypothetical protein VFB00_05595 [Terriglobales bacterium]|nr:hypothetical protein [Terriglobales bacterium]